MTLVLLVLFTLSACNNDDNSGTPIEESRFIWKKIGLNELKINKLLLEDNFLYAVTEDGIYRKNSVDDSSFQPIGLQGLNIEDIVIFSPNELLASVADFQEDIIIHIATTDDGGQNWQVLESDFGGGFDPHIVWDFLKPQNSEDDLYASSNYVVARSTNKGVHWSPIWGDWDQFTRATSVVAINPLLPNEIWLGGQGGIEDGYLIRLNGDTEANRWTDLVPNPTTVKNITFDTQSPQSIYVGFEGALLKTSNNGQSWQTLIDEHESARFFNGIVLSTLDTRKVYTSGWLKTDEPQPLLLYYSTDAGTTWKHEIFTEETYGGVEDMVMTTIGNQEHLFLALNKGGVYEVIEK